MTEACRDILPPLERLEQRVAQGLRTLPFAQVSGLVVEVSMSHYRVAGLSRFLKLGESVGVDVGDRVEIGEVVRIDGASATLKPFDTRSDVTIGARAFRTETLALSPHRAWKGRVIDALGRPIDGEGELPQGERPAPLDAPPPPPSGARAFMRRCAPACALSTSSPHSPSGREWAYSQALASASRRCSQCWPGRPRSTRLSLRSSASVAAKCGSFFTTR
jgi:hypothetical protein